MYVQTTKNKTKHAGERAPSRRLFRFVLYRFLSSGHAAYSRSPSFASCCCYCVCCIINIQNPTSFGSLAPSFVRSLIRSLVAAPTVSLSAMLLVLTFTKQRSKRSEHKIGSTLVNFCFFCTHFSYESRFFFLFCHTHCFTCLLRCECLLIVSPFLSLSLLLQ